MKKALFSLLGLLLLSGLTAQSGSVMISEFMAINSNSIVDEDGEHSDWIELYNTGSESINLEGWFLTDKADNLSKWKFPAVTLEADKYLIVFASEKNRKVAGQQLHTNFKLSGTGEYLAIVAPDTTVSHAYQPQFPAQRNDVSYGIYHGQAVYFNTPTPGAGNLAGNLPFAPAFSESRGYFKDPVQVSLSVASSASIYYTTDGTRPTATNGTLYSSPLTISTTTPLSAVAVDDQGNSSEIITHTYLFIDQIIRQPKAPQGYPTDWKQAASSTTIKADYEMDARVVDHADYKNSWVEVFHDIPTVSFVTNTGYLFSDQENATTGGIYIYTGKPSAIGVDWIRPASAEYFDPKNGKQFQINCGLMLHGGNSRTPSNSPKHGFKLKFKSEYGPSKLNFNLFDDATATNEFNSLVFRAGYNNTWVKNSVAQQLLGQYIQDSWSKTTQLDMGQPAAHEKFVHLYLNGLYWGLYNISEQLTDDFMESYLKGKEEDFDVIKEKDAVSAGNLTAWNALKSQISGVATNENYQKIQGRNPDGSVNPAYQNLIEVDNYIDYMLINYYIGNKDWDKNNWTVSRNRVNNDSGFRFFCWDTETSMVSLNDNLVVNGTAGNPMAFIQHLKKNTDFKVKIADRIKQLLLDQGGLLTPEGVSARYEKLADEIEIAIIGESARWSDWYAPYNPYTKNDHWIPRKNDLMENYFPERTDILLSQLKAYGLYPSVDAPTLSHPTGNYAESFKLSMTTNTGTIYYSTDGTDPRLTIANTVSNNALTYGSPVNIDQATTIRARAKTSTEWSAISEAVYTMNPINSIETHILGALESKSYPNPFTYSTRIAYRLPVSGNVKVSIYGLDGSLIEELVNGMQFSGDQELEWTPRTDQRGVFICRITYQGQHHHLKLIRQ